MSPKIIVVDDSTIRQPYLTGMLQCSGKVVGFTQQQAAITAVNRGMNVDVAVLHYRGAMGSLIQAIRTQCPEVKIVAFGNARSETPLGVDRYLNKPILGALVREAVEEIAPKHRAGR